MEKITACPVCQSESLEPYLTIPDHFLTQERFGIQQCRQCHFLLTNPRPEEKQAVDYYESDAYISHSDTNKGIISRIYKQVRNYALKQKVELVKKYVAGGQALDIGCGTGHFLSLLAESGFSVTGVEPGEQARKQAVENFNLQVKQQISDLPDNPDQFDAISLWHVLEHVYTLQEHLERIAHMLKSNGVLIIAVPNPASYDASYYKEFWAAWDVPRHLYHFSQDTLTQLMARYNYTLSETIPMKFDAYYVSLLSEKYKNSHTRYPSALYRGFISNLKAKSNQQNYSSLIYVFQPKKS